MDWMQDAEILKLWGAPPMVPEEEGINPKHLQRLRYNPDYEEVDENEVKIGNSVVIGTYASSQGGTPNIRWTEIVVKELPLRHAHPGFIEVRRKKIK